MGSNQELMLRSTLTPGSFSITNDGIINFPTEGDFYQTVDYITTDTSLQQLNCFRSSLSIVSLNKKADHVVDSIESHLNYTSKALLIWSDYLNYLNITVVQGDTMLSNKFGIWGEFLNLQNLVIIEGYLYKITPDKTIIITDGDRNKLTVAEGLTSSDTANEIRIISPRVCACSLTGHEWSEEQTVTNDNVRSWSMLTFSNLTLAKYLPQHKVRVTPKWSISTHIRIQKRSIVGWHLERKTIAFNRQINLKHNFQSIPFGSPNMQPDGTWNESTGWNQYESDFKYKTSYGYSPYTTTQLAEMPDGYCMSIRIFAQTANITNPTIINQFYYYPYYEQDLDWDFLRYCSNFSWLL